MTQKSTMKTSRFTERIYAAQNVRRTWAAGLEAVARVLIDEEVDKNVAELSRKILKAVGFHE